VQAAINAVHSDAATAADTDWPQILALYDHLAALMPGPVVALHRLRRSVCTRSVPTADRQRAMSW
jgi:predicted RNA polymerase sigma factor